MDTSTLHDLLLRIGPEIRSTANFIEEAFGEVGVGQASAKSLNSLVSYVDVESEKRLVEVLSKALPEAGFVTESVGIDQRLQHLETAAPDDSTVLSPSPAAWRNDIHAVNQQLSDLENAPYPDVASFEK